MISRCLSLVLLAGSAHLYALPRVAIFATGGTISGKHDAAKGGYIAGAASGQELVAAVPRLKKIAEFQIEQVASINSADMTPELWVDLAARIQRVLANPNIVGAVVTHGTNTLEETAYFLDLVISGTKPVVVVGAQRPASDPYSDSPLNLLQAVQVAVDPDARGKGALFVLWRSSYRRPVTSRFPGNMTRCALLTS